MTQQTGLLLAYFTGIVIQGLSLFRRKPARGLILAFLICMALSIGMIGFVIIQQPRTFEGELFSLGFMLTFFIVACFISVLLRKITLANLYSLTISYWLLLYKSTILLPPVAVIILAGVGICATGLFCLVVFKIITLRNPLKVLLYGWFLFINAVFAILYYSIFQPNFIYDVHNNQTILVGQSYLGMLLFGMILVNTAVSAGVLYYAIMYYWIKSIRKQLTDFIPQVFSDQPLLLYEWLLIPFVQFGLTWLCFTINQLFGFYFLVTCILIGPKIQQMYWKIIRV